MLERRRVEVKLRRSGEREERRSSGVSNDCEGRVVGTLRDISVTHTTVWVRTEGGPTKHVLPGNTCWSTPLWKHVVSPPSDPNSGSFRPQARPFLRGIDVNRLPSTVGNEEEVGVSSPNSTISSVGAKRSEREANGGISDEEDGDTSRKKIRLSKDQSTILEESFKEHNTLNPKQKLALAKQLGLRPRQVEVWFQNRRARTGLN
ncbi:hypothetical protein V6N13_133848 [Hibiscus sabdariffa]|uniref:Homeobox domain-containing protein n=1 Tax=Hibiscus sabdariffa TaxID=183260 RepID=A0ABR2QZZ5_9ROSI